MLVMQSHRLFCVGWTLMSKNLLFLFLCLPSWSLAQLEHQGWSETQTFPGGARDDGSAFSIQGKGYFGCGIDQYYQLRNDWWVYDATAKSWTQTADLPGRPRQYATVLATGDFAYLIAGITDSSGYSSEVFRFDPVNESWTQLPDAPFSARAAGAGFRIGDDLYFGTGRNDTTQFSDFWRYDTYYEQWKQLDSLPFIGRDEISGFSADGYGYLMLGRDSLAAHNDLWRFDPSRNEWSLQNDYPGEARSYAAVVEEPGGAVVAGGMSADGALLSESYYYEAKTGQWQKLDDLPVQPVRGMEGFRLSNEVYFCGGLALNFTRLDRVQVLSLSEEELDVRIQVWPVPAREHLRAHLEWEIQIGTGTLDVFDIQGRQLFHMELEPDRFDFDIPVIALQNGIYYMRLQVGEETYLHPFMVMR